MSRPNTVLLALCSVALSWGSEIIRIEPSADTAVSESLKGHNSGSEPLLTLRGSDDKALLRFDLRALPRNAAVVSAKLAVTFQALTADHDLGLKRYSVHELISGFEESEANYLQAVKGRAWAHEGLRRYEDYVYSHSNSLMFSLRSAGRSTVDVTQLIRSMQAAGKTSAGFVIAGRELNAGGTIASREHSDAQARPLLEIEYSYTVPIARAGGEAFSRVLPVRVDGSQSSLPDGRKSGLAYTWQLETPSPGSGYEKGARLGDSPILEFRPKAPGYYVLKLIVTNQATGEAAEDTCGVIAGLNPHPRLHVNPGLLDRIKQQKASNDPAWIRFHRWVSGKPESSDIEGAVTASYLLAHLVTGEQRFFDWAWERLRRNIYRNGTDRSGGLIRIMDVYKNNPHDAAYLGGQLIADMAILYDWGYDRLTVDQREDLIAWMNDASEYNYLHNGSAVAYFRNDGAVFTYGLAALAYATLGENPKAMDRFRWFRSNWHEHLKALDIMGVGGALGEGNGNGTSPTASSFISIANMLYYASGEDVFASHPWFKARLAYDAFAAYPGYTRQAAAPGSKTRWTEPFVEQSPVNGDGRRGVSWHSAYLRHNGLMLARRFAGSEEANIWNWVYRQAETDRVLNDSESFCDLLYSSPRPKLAKPAKLSFFDPSMGFVYIRSDWDSPDATWIAIWAGPHIDTHQHLDQGGFELFKRRNLAPKTGNSDLFFNGHRWAWYGRTVSSNGLLVGDPKEIFRNFVAGMGCDEKGEGTRLPSPDNSKVLCIPNDGGQRTMSPFSLAPQSADVFDAYRQVFDVAKVVHYSDDGEVVAVSADITNAYNSARHSTPGSAPKVSRVYRQFVYLRKADALLVADTVESTDPSFEKKVVIHGLDRIELGGTVENVSPGESLHCGVNEARIVVDDREPSDKFQTTVDLRQGYAALLLKTVFPVAFRYRKIGGREPADTPHGDVYEPDGNGWSAGHFHRHVKDFWVRDFNAGVIPNHASANWIPERPHEVWSPENIPDFGGGYGRWRIEIEPTRPATTDYFLNVMTPTLEKNAEGPGVRRLETNDQFGAEIILGELRYRVLFPKAKLAAPKVEKF